jgi:putative ATPase
MQVTDDALAHWAETCDGDARRALTALEIAVLSFPIGVEPMIDRQVAIDSIQRKALVHDATGDEHYDVVSAFIKSMRGSDPDAAVYWLARLLEAGEEPRFIARRLIIFASEDVGCADPHALPIAAGALQAVEFVGLPECQLNLAHATIYLATAPKSAATTQALGAAKKDVAEGRTLGVPSHLRDSHYAGAKSLGHGQGYKHPQRDPEGARDQRYISADVRYYVPTDNGAEAHIKRRMEELRFHRDENSPAPS